MSTQTFLGTLKVRIGEYENNVRYLVVANSFAAAETVFRGVAAQYYSTDEGAEEDGGFYANGGEVHVSPNNLRPIGLSTFLELKQHLPVRCAENVTAPTLDMLEGVQSAAAALRHSLAAGGVEIGHSNLLNALAASWGEKNWQVLKAKVGSPDRAAIKALIAAAQAVVDNADDIGCSDDMTVTSKEALDRLSGLLSEQSA